MIPVRAKIPKTANVILSATQGTRDITSNRQNLIKAIHQEQKADGNLAKEEVAWCLKVDMYQIWTCRDRVEENSKEQQESAVAQCSVGNDVPPNDTSKP